jgi:hypothetical protein
MHFLSSACGHYQAFLIGRVELARSGHNFNCAAGVVGLLSTGSAAPPELASSCLFTPKCLHGKSLHTRCLHTKCPPTAAHSIDQLGLFSDSGAFRFGRPHICNSPIDSGCYSQQFSEMNAMTAAIRARR